MAENQKNGDTVKVSETPVLDSGTYEIIRQRLDTNAKSLKGCLEQLNSARKAVFGTVDTALSASERITTRNSCVPRDMATFGNKFLFGYNVQFGLKSMTGIEDVFALYDYQNKVFTETSLDLLKDQRFSRDFQELYKYYKNTSLAKIQIISPFLYMIFSTGKDVTDVKTFKWKIDGTSLEYIDNRSERDVTLPPQQEFEWKRTHRDFFRKGTNPHISIEDRIFVETIGGDLTIKIEDNTNTGKGIYAEPVENPDQTLDDAEYFYCCLENIILLKIKPFQEKKYRYFLYNEKTQKVHRIDSIEQACVLLPDNQGVIFPNGYYLQTGTYKIFDSINDNLRFERRIQSPNGEDYQYVFYENNSGMYIIIPYNSISQEIATPIVCSGFSYFDNGELILFKADIEPRNNHVIQIWQTPFCSHDYTPPAINSESFYYKIGNKDIVKCMSDCQTVLSLLFKDDSWANLYIDITRETDRVLDAYFWIDKPEAFGLREILQQVRTVSSSAVEEFDKVSRTRKSTADAIAAVKNATKELLESSELRDNTSVEKFVASLAQLRSLRGEIISLKELKYADINSINNLETSVKERIDKLSAACITFLLKPESLNPYRKRTEEMGISITAIERTNEGKKKEDALDAIGTDLELLIDIVNNLKIDDPANATIIIEAISAIFSDLNKTRSALRLRMKELRRSEGSAEFSAQIKLLDQSVANYLDLAESAEKCDEFYSKTVLQLEELDGKFADFDEFLPLLAQKRTEIQQAFESRKILLQEQRARTCAAVMSAAERILKGIETKARSFTTQNEINAYFASDLMVGKLRELQEKLELFNDTVKAEDIQSKLKTLKEDASRQLKDRSDLFTEGDNLIKLGKHSFTVNTQPLDLTIVFKDNALFYHLTGTDFFERVPSSELQSAQDVWSQEYISETADLYRGEYLAWQLLTSSINGTFAKPEEIAAWSEQELLTQITRFMSPRYDEGYVKGVHDHDASLILRELLHLHTSTGLLTFDPSARSLARLFWIWDEHTEFKRTCEKYLRGIAQVSQVFKTPGKYVEIKTQIVKLLIEFCRTVPFIADSYIDQSAEYLCEELKKGTPFVISMEADQHCRAFYDSLREQRMLQVFTDSVAVLRDAQPLQIDLINNWFRAYTDASDEKIDQEFVPEAVTLIVAEQLFNQNYRGSSAVIQVPSVRTVQGLRGDHSTIKNGQHTFTYASFSRKLTSYITNGAIKFERYRNERKALLQQFKKDLKLDEFTPRVMSSFVRNKLINELYLPLIGDNFAKQIGAAGNKKRTDLMGMLLLISPPGYGKTTLMEYVANRLGLIFMKINGPAVGNKVTSLDPSEAPNASAREEIEKLNLALEMGNNVMIYVDDIQHVSPEFLEKFISLCDAQRKIEGVYKGNSKTYDLRGKKVAVVMAGNPYTESGERFKVPDMLANRADTYNLGDMLSANEKAFKLSYLENALTSNLVLSELSNRNASDLYSIVNAVEQNNFDSLALEGDYGQDLRNDVITITKKLLTVRDIVLRVNQEYIRSAAQANEYRTEPPFKLQGSYRNMNRIAERVVPVMNEKELFNLVLQSYENDAQTLTTGAEANLLKWKELQGCQSESDSQRWGEIKRVFNQHKLVQADDKFGQAVLQLGKLSDGLEDIKKVIASKPSTNSNDLQKEQFLKLEPSMHKQIDKIIAGLTMTSKTSLEKSPVNTQETTAALVMVLENQTKVLNEWLVTLQNTSEKHSVNVESLQTAINRSLWFQRELVARFLKDERMERKEDKQGKDLSKDLH
jgi:hypothetical protein